MKARLKVCVRKSSFLLLLACLAVGSALCYGQATTGSIVGIVTDPSGAAVPHATITVKAQSTGLVRVVISNETGFYALPGLPPDHYEATAVAPGFSSINTRINVTINSDNRWDVALKTGQVTETVTVSDIAATIETDSHQLDQTLSSEQIETQPANGRTLFSTLTSATNVQGYTGSGISANDIDYYKMQANSLVIGGSLYGTTEFLQDGVTNFNYLTKTANFQPPIEATKEVSILRNGASARFDSPNVVNVVTKGGTNHFHGRLYDYLKNDDLDAVGGTNYAAGSAPTKPPLRYNQFGVNVGGPIFHNRLFAFFDYAGLRNLNSAHSYGIVASDAERAGNFGELLPKTVIYDPDTYNSTTGAISAFPQNIIPSDRISDFAKKYLDYFPRTSPSDRAGYNYEETVGNSTNYNSYTGRVDYTIGASDSIYGAFMTTRPVQTTISIAAVRYFDNENINGATNTYVEETHVFSPALVNIFRVGYNRSDVLYTLHGVGAMNFSQYFNIPALEGTPLSQSLPPTVAITSFSGMGSSTLPQGALQNLYQYSDEVTWTRGRHTVFAGVALQRLQFNGNWVIFNNGSFSFKGQYTSNHALKPTGGSGLADFMLGIPSSAEGGIGSTVASFRQYNVMPYVQDDWRIDKHLTLNLGLRYDYYEAPFDKNGHSNIYDVYTNTNHAGTYRQQYTNFAPRIGFAYSITPATSLRGGYGIYYTSLFYNELQFMMANLPNFYLQNYTYTASQVNTIGSTLSSNPSTSSQAPFTIALNFPTSYVQERNLSVQHSFGPRLITEIAYLGSTADHLMMRHNPNQAYLPADPASPASLQARRPYSWVGDVYEITDAAAANYNGLELSVRGNSGKLGSYFASFVYSKSLDDLTSEEKPPLDSHNLQRDYALSDFNRKFFLKLGGDLHLPLVGSSGALFHTSNIVVNEFAGGWTLSGLMQVYSGEPFYVQATDLSNTGSYHGTRANRTCNGNNFARRSRTEWFNTSCYSQPSNYQLGSEPRNDLIAPRNTSTNLSLFKDFALPEGSAVEFRTDAFGVFNHPFPGPPVANVTVSNNGQLQSYGGGRILQVSLKLKF